MPFSSITNSAADALRNAGSYVSDLMTPTVRLGVTGLSRAGKTVFITSLVRNLIVGGRLPFFRAHASGRILRAYLEPQPDDAVPRFDYERHLATISADPPDWPNSTRRISELRVTIEYEPDGALMRYLGPAKLHLDIVDYPGEWLTDLALLDKSYAAWADETVAILGSRPKSPAVTAFLDFVARLDAAASSADADGEQLALEGAALFTAALGEARRLDGGIATLSPGRFLMPGDLEGSPLLTFFPLPGRGVTAGNGGPQGAAAPHMTALLARRYDSYRAHVVKPFFKDHFSRIDRQIVLVDVLGALHTGARAVADLERAIGGVLAAFRPGSNSWLSSLLSQRVDHVLIAATKADHLHHTSHDRLEAVLRLVTDRAINRAEASGASVRVMALA
ncbi:MAG: YcjX family protein, partial [Hyphomicrobiaceae bacterium]